MRKIGAKIVIMSIILILVGQISNAVNYINIQTVNNLSNKIIDTYFASMQKLNTLSSDYVMIQKDILAAANSNTEEELKNIEKEISEKNGEITTSIQAIDNNFSTQKEKDIVDDFINSYDNYYNQYSDTLSLIEKGNKFDAQNKIDSQLKYASQNVEIKIESINVLNKVDIMRAKKEQSSARKKCIIAMITASAIMFLVLIVSMIFTKRRISNPLKNAAKQVNSIVNQILNNNGDLTKRLKIETNDEIGMLQKNINDFLDILQKIIKVLKANSNKLSNSTFEVSNKVLKADESVSNTSSTMEELSAGMQEISSNILKLDNDSSDIKESMNLISDKAQNGCLFAKDVKNRANNLMNQTVGAKEKTYNMVNSISDSLNKAIGVSIEM